MLLDEFRTEVRRRMGLPITDPHHISSATFPLIMEAAERKFAISNNALYDKATFLEDLLTYTDIFGAFCGWADQHGNVHAFGYACHESFRYLFTPDCFEAENTMAHVSTSNTDIEDMMMCVKNPRLKTKRMTRGILTFCHSVNQNQWWHEQVLIHHFSGSRSVDFEIKCRATPPTQAELSNYLRNIMPNEMPLVKMAQPYGHINEVIKTTNEHARSEREIIKPYDDAAMQAKFRPSRMFRDYREADYYGDQTKMPVADFQRSLAQIGY